MLTRTLPLLLLSTLLLITGPSFAAESASPVADLQQTALEQPDFAARQTALDRRTAENNYRYQVAQHNCYAHFLVNFCLNRALTVMQKERDAIRTAQLQLNQEKRAFHARQREQRAAQRLAQERAQAPQRALTEQQNAAYSAQKLRQYQQAQAQRQAEQPAIEAAHQAAYDQKQATAQASLASAQRNRLTEQQRRAKNVARFEAKQRAAAKHRKYIEERQQRARSADSNISSPQH
jgi:hypothetical protein